MSHCTNCGAITLLAHLRHNLRLCRNCAVHRYGEDVVVSILTFT